MSAIRFSIKEAVERGFIDKAEATKMRGAAERRRLRIHPGARAAEDDAPASRLWVAVQDLGDAHREFKKAVPGRNFSLDIAFPSCKLCCEVDGWEWHGKHKGDFQRDRERQNLLTLNGWRILRFTAKDIRGDIEGCRNQIMQALSA